MRFIKERIAKLVETLDMLRYPLSLPVAGYEIAQAEERPAQEADMGPWQPYDPSRALDAHRRYYQLRTTLTIPPEMDGKTVLYELSTGRESEWDATNPQFAVYIDGVLRQGLDTNHTQVLLADSARAGHTCQLLLALYTGEETFDLSISSRLRVLEKETQRYYYDVKIALDTASLLSPEDDAHIRLIASLNNSMNLLDLREPGSPAYHESLRLAADCLRKALYQHPATPDSPVVYSVGHTHIDVAWKWTLAVTRDKAVRSFSTALELMRQYPEYIFMSSQPQLYQYVKEDAPAVYEEIRQRVAEGRWEVDGGMWVEADCNLASGEALVRQFLYGQRFFREEFGKECQILWLPDVFGYSAALPQIMKKCGLRYFMTTKISWNDTNQMPYDTFLWEGIDGSRVLSHFSPTKDSLGLTEGNEDLQDFFTTYCGEMTASQVKGAWERYQQKTLNREVLTLFGHGDGGGGTTPEMIENQRRMAVGLPGLPRTQISTAGAFFNTLEQQTTGSRALPVWAGELYFEYHRGTYTSMAQNKKYNRRSEFLALNTELYSAIHSTFGGRYPAAEIDAQWEVILRNQFHDILPGSSIYEVYEDSRREYEGVLQALGALEAEALLGITRQVDAPENSLVVFNSNGFEADGLVEIPAHNAANLNGQHTANGTLLLEVKGIPAKGYRALLLQELAPSGTDGVSVSARRMENAFFVLELDEKGQFASIWDKRAERELLPAGTRGNVLMTYEDRPQNYDAWDIDCYYTEKAWEVDDLQDTAVVEAGPVRWVVRNTRRYLHSTIQEFITLYRNIPRIDIRYEVDWHQHQILLKSLFPLDIHTNEATFDIQYGNVTRPTHRNTSWDVARFEVCHHKWLDVSEGDFGVSFLNDCKYGCSIQDGTVGLTLLKSGIDPNPVADQGHHTFTYSILPHSGGWQQGQTVQQAYLLNNPLQARVKQERGGNGAAAYSFVRSSASSVLVEAIKQAESGKGYILRLYEYQNTRAKTRLTFPRPVQAAAECDLLERETGPVAVNGQTLELSFHPYEIKTLRVEF